MKTYLKNLIARLERYSDKLNNTSLFIDHPWVLIDGEANYHKYIFKRNGDLIMSINGDAQVGKWEYLPSAESLLIDRVDSKLLLNQLFCNEGVMILKYDGFKDDLFILANQKIMPDLNLVNYLKDLFYQKHDIIAGQTYDGRTIEIYREGVEVPQVGMKVTIDGLEPNYGAYQSKHTQIKYFVSDGKIIKIAYPTKYECTNGAVLTIDQIKKEAFSKGDKIFIDNKPASTGKYKLKKYGIIIVEEGKIKKIPFFQI